MPTASRLKSRARLQVLKVLGPQLGNQHGAFGWVATTALNRLHRAVIRNSVRVLAPGAGGTVADIGFGGGLGLGLLLEAVGPQGTVHGIEITELPIRRATMTYRRAVRDRRLQLHQASVAQLPMADGTVDGVITINTIHHFDDLGAAFSSIARVLTDGGRVVIGFPDPARMRTQPMTGRHGHRPRSVEEVCAELDAAGLHLANHERIQDGAYHLLLATGREEG